MKTEEVRADFAQRVELLCDELGIPRGHGRQTALGKMFGVTAKAARKWLMGQSYPEMPLAVTMCDKAGVNVLWLLQGVQPMRIDRTDHGLFLLARAIDALPAQSRNNILEYVRYQIERQSAGWFTGEQVRTYLVQLDSAQKHPQLGYSGGKTPCHN